MATRLAGTARSRDPVKGRPVSLGNPIGKGPKTRAVAQPMVTPIFDHCRDKNKQGQPCKAHNVTGEPYCQGHKSKREAIRNRD